MSKLSPKSFAVLSLIAEGYSYGQIIDGHPEITYLDIFHAAEEALKLSESVTSYQERMAKIKEKYPKAYEKWEASEDGQLRSMYSSGTGILELSTHFQRQPSAIRSRLEKLGLQYPESQRS